MGENYILFLLNMLMIMVRILTNFFEIAENGEEVGRGRAR
jgi:hypothetical protein